MATEVSGIGPIRFTHVTFVLSLCGSEIESVHFFSNYPFRHRRGLPPVEINYHDVDPYDEEWRFHDSVMWLGLIEYWQLRSMLADTLPTYDEAARVLLSYALPEAGKAEVIYLRHLCEMVKRLHCQNWRLGNDSSFAQVLVGEVDEDLLVDAFAHFLLDLHNPADAT